MALSMLILTISIGHAIRQSCCNYSKVECNNLPYCRITPPLTLSILNVRLKEWRLAETKHSGEAEVAVLAWEKEIKLFRSRDVMVIVGVDLI